ncbi:hypothetical protein Rhopal_002545-T1 [Rhodotorula paludigena]|uniref:Right handed beta helix domain-containing protein n=1 Tax=Rhodotorula paludigena TaxID=86838 RepID=A0AAV5GLK8_9BASI|nr:hypothetical protein Rhopal_002545-T1 [Rhodotorula paludigena]
MPASSLASLASLALLALSSLAAALPRPSGTQAARRSLATPNADLTPHYLEDKEISAAIARMVAAAQASAAVKATRRSLDDVVDVDIQKRGDVGGDTLLKERAPTCLDSTATDTLISSMFYYGGENTIVELCPNADIKLTGPVFFSAKNQVLRTQARAKLTVTGEDQSCAIYATCTGCDNLLIESIQIDGSRDTMGYNSGIALVEMGGSNIGQTIRSSKVWEPRGWSAVHIIEGNGNTCSGAKVTDNEIGPSGNSPTDGAQFKRDQTVYPPHQWADGISLACKGSTVSGNTIIDATDGGIVIFGAPGSSVRGNTIIARERRPLGGINLVDYEPFSGSYEGTIVEGNTLIADTNMMKLGIGLGGMSWGSDNRTASRTFGGTVRNNKFMSGSTGYFGYAISVAGHMNAVISGNDASGAQFGGKASSSCIPVPAVPASQAFVYDRYTSVGSQMQDNFVDADLVFLICQEPGSVVSKGVVKAATGMMTAGKEAAGDVVDSVASSVIDPSSAVTTTSPASASTNATSVLDRLFDLVQTVAHTVVPRSTKSRINWRERMSLKNAAKSASAAAAKTTGIRQIWSQRVASVTTRSIIQDGDNVLAERDAAPAARSTPVAALVNPFDLLEKTQRLV